MLLCARRTHPNFKIAIRGRFFKGVYDQQIRDFHIGLMGYDMVRLVIASRWYDQC